MALINCDFFAETLGLSSSMTVILPQKTTGQIGMTGVAENSEFPVLYLLHGSSDDHSIWLRRTSIERYVAELGIAVVMPNVHRSYYSNMKHGGNYWDFIAEELPAIVKSFFHVSDKREDTFVAGLSMGGYGAMKLGLSCPERFAAAASLSGALDINSWRNSMDFNRKEEFLRIFGEPENFNGSSNDLFHLARKLRESGKQQPALFQCCGQNDFLYQNNLNFRDFLQENSFELTYEEGPGTHEWAFWDLWIQRVLAWLPIKSREK